MNHAAASMSKAHGQRKLQVQAAPQLADVLTLCSCKSRALSEHANLSQAMKLRIPGAPRKVFKASGVAVKTDGCFELLRAGRQVPKPSKATDHLKSDTPAISLNPHSDTQSDTQASAVLESPWPILATNPWLLAHKPDT